LDQKDGEIDYLTSMDATKYGRIGGNH